MGKLVLWESLKQQGKQVDDKMRGKSWTNPDQYRSYLNFLYAVLTVASLSLCGAIYYSWWAQVPEQIRLHSNTEQNLEFHVPASGQIYPAEGGYSRRENAAEEYGTGTALSGRSRSAYETREVLETRNVWAKGTPVSLDRPVTFVAGEQMSKYVMKLKLFGILPFKEVDIQVVQDEAIIPAGLPVGIYVKTQGVLVLGTGEFTAQSGQSEAPAEGILRSGDYILQIDGEEVNAKKEFMSVVGNSGGRELILRVRRAEEIFDVKVEPKLTQNGEYKIGVWIRENAQGVGTLTYVREDGSFGALGHGINDMDTSTLMEVESGSLYETEIVGIRKGKDGMPGELTGIIDYSPERRIGSIEQNTTRGIFGSGNEKLLQEAEEQPLHIGFKQEVHTGEAQIICSITGQPEHYRVEIEEVHPEKEDMNRGIVLRITDEKLLALTGGIVQGMSGSPILQNGKIVGAVTHVLVNDPTRGYGIFIENMLEAAE
ncbi:MAG: SpoIVB peptidase [Lachnospiraceae bacterium]|nr:SpoIVB peptidase [Lachnospiraceae bacterium]